MGAAVEIGARAACWLAEARRSVEDKGFAVVRGGGEEGFAALTSSLGDVVQLYDVRVRPETPALVTSHEALAPHTDHHAVRYIAWHCLRPAESGGSSLVVDGWRVLDELGASDRAALRNVVLFEHRVFPGDRDSCPMLRTEGGAERLYYSYWLRQALSPEEERAFGRFRKLSESKRFVRWIDLDAGDVLVVDNQRMLHGRSQIRPPFVRHLRRAWIRNP